MSIKVDDVSTWPASIVEGMMTASVRQCFMKSTWIDTVYKHPDVRAIGTALVECCYQSGLIGYHCTKERHPGFYIQNGLELTDPQAKIDSFLAEYGQRFSESKLEEIKFQYEQWLSSKQQMRAREGKVWFCLTKSPVMSSGTNLFFRFYGGEIIYWPFHRRDVEVEAVLEQIGSPVVVEAILDPSDL